VSAAVVAEGTRSLVGDGFALVNEAAQFLRVSRSKVYMLMDAGELPYARFGRNRRIPRRALMEYAERSLVAR
jgi:excisionase family DNA binding protein